MPQIRCFVGLPVPESVASAAVEMQESVARRAPESFRWVAKESMHVTLAFLGDVRREDIEPLTKVLTTIEHPVFSLRTGRLLALPRPSVPRVLAMELEGQVDSARALADRVRSLASPFSTHQEHKPFLAHLTIGRLRREANGMSREVQAGLTVQRFGPPAVWKVPCIQLLQSHLEPQGPRYEVRAEHKLKDADLG